MRKKMVLLSLLAIVILAACGGGDSHKIKLEDATFFEGMCNNYSLRVRYEGIEGQSHLVETREVGTTNVIDSETWAEGGWFFWRELSCDEESPTWDADKQGCRYDIVVTSGEEQSKTETVEIECN